MYVCMYIYICCFYYTYVYIYIYICIYTYIIHGGVCAAAQAVRQPAAKHDGRANPVH